MRSRLPQRQGVPFSADGEKKFLDNVSRFVNSLSQFAEAHAAWSGAPKITESHVEKAYLDLERSKTRLSIFRGLQLLFGGAFVGAAAQGIPTEYKVNDFNMVLFYAAMLVVGILLFFLGARKS